MSKIKQLRKIKKSKPHKFWIFLNGNKKYSAEVTVENCFEYFKTMNSSGDHENVPETNFDINAENLEADNEEINGPILWSEIEKAVCSLKNNKSGVLDTLKNNKSGVLDMILNAHIKDCYKVPTMKDILLNF